MSKSSKKLLDDETEMNMTPMIDIVFNLLIFFMVVTDLTQKELATMVLPLAHTAVQDKANDPDERLILNIDEKGRLLYRGKPLSLNDLGRKLEHAKNFYNRRQRDKGESGTIMLEGGEASKLFVLLRADRNTPWQHVQWVMTIMAEQKIYKLQFATKIYADSHYRKEGDSSIPEDLVEQLGGKWQEN